MIRWPGSTCCLEHQACSNRSAQIDYPTLKLIHVSCVAMSYMFFVVRGVWMLRQSPLLRQGWVRVTPHVVDTALLVSAIALAVTIRQYPLVAGWLTAKVVALVCYIGLGMIAFRFGRSRGHRLVAWLAAQAVFFYIVAVALARDPLPWRWTG
jgi:uncharacterized membrane protein SirB2